MRVFISLCLLACLSLAESLVGKTYIELKLDNDFTAVKEPIAPLIGDTKIDTQNFYKNLKNDQVCPIKGVKLSLYQKWLGFVQFKDGKLIAISSPKYTFVYYNSLKDEVRNLYVTDFQSGKLIDAYGAFYVFGSRALSVGGDDVVPFESEKEARKFMQKEGGTRIFGFERMDKSFLDYLEMR